MADVGIRRLVDVSGQNQSGVMKTMLFFSMAMLTLPILSYFLSKSLVFEGIFHMNNSNSYFYAAIVAIVAVHVILAMFVYAAWVEGSRAILTIKKD